MQPTSLTSIVFTLTALENTSIPIDSGRILQAAFLNWFKGQHPELTAKLHDANYQRPYTISPLHGPFARERRWLHIKKDQQGWFRLTGIEQHFNQCVLESIASYKHSPQPDDRRLIPGPVLQTPAKHDWVAASSFERLLRHIQQQGEHLPEQVALSFKSPTCFIENKKSLPLPVPRFVFGYLANQWQMASPVALPIEDLQHFVESIQLAHARIDTR